MAGDLQLDAGALIRQDGLLANPALTNGRSKLEELLKEVLQVLGNSSATWILDTLCALTTL